MAIDVGELRAQTSLEASGTPVVIVTDDQALGRLKLEAFRAYNTELGSLQIRVSTEKERAAQTQKQKPLSVGSLREGLALMDANDVIVLWACDVRLAQAQPEVLEAFPDTDRKFKLRISSLSKG